MNIKILPPLTPEGVVGYDQSERLVFLTVPVVSTLTWQTTVAGVQTIILLPLGSDLKITNNML